MTSLSYVQSSLTSPPRGKAIVLSNLLDSAGAAAAAARSAAAAKRRGVGNRAGMASPSCGAVLLLVVHERRAHSDLRRIGGVERAHAHGDPVRLVLEAVDRDAAVARLEDLPVLVEDLDDELDLELLGAPVGDLELPPQPRGVLGVV